MKYLITIVGPTAIGKTSLSIALAQHFNCEIISSDSRQFYKEMTIGTAVPSELELSSANHHFIHNKSIFDNYNVGDFEKEALSKLDELFKTNDFAILVGGSGLYVDAILKGFDAIPEIDKSVRDSVISDYEINGIEYLQESLKKLDPNYYADLTQKNPQTLSNPQRMMRFLEVCLGTEKPYSTFINQNKNQRRHIIGCSGNGKRFGCLFCRQPHFQVFLGKWKANVVQRCFFSWTIINLPTHLFNFTFS